MLAYLKEKRDKDKGYDSSYEIKIALTILGFIDCDILIRDVMNFYIKHCLKLAKGQDKVTKIKVILDYQIKSFEGLFEELFIIYLHV